MVAIWEAETKFRIWFEIEAHALDKMAELGTVPVEAAKAVWERGAFEVERIDTIEAEVKHDVIAFLTNVAEHVGPEARFLHQGMTSSDVLDTCLNVQLTRAADLLVEDIDKVRFHVEQAELEHGEQPDRARANDESVGGNHFGLGQHSKKPSRNSQCFWDWRLSSGGTALGKEKTWGARCCFDV